MTRIEADTLQEAYSKAARELSCSVVDLDINIIQNGSGGFLGMFKKSAIIEVARKGARVREEREKKETPVQRHEEVEKNAVLTEEKRSDRSRRNKNRRNKNKNRDSVKTDEVSERKSEPQEVKKVETKEVVHQRIEHPKKETPAPKPMIKEMKHTLAQTPIDQNFHQEKRDINEVISEVSVQVKNLFKYSCFTLDVPTVSKYNEDTILIEFSGEDAALLIGKEGYRYKALSYLLYNWINIKYALNIRLEIAEFLKNQEEMIQKYLLPVMERIRNSGRGQTKILDGVLIKIALEALRAEFPEKYVGIKSGKEGGKFIVVNDFNRKTT